MVRPLPQAATVRSPAHPLRLELSACGTLRHEPKGRVRYVGEEIVTLEPVESKDLFLNRLEPQTEGPQMRHEDGDQALGETFCLELDPVHHEGDHLLVGVVCELFREPRPIKSRPRSSAEVYGTDGRRAKVPHTAAGLRNHPLLADHDWRRTPQVRIPNIVAQKRDPFEVVTQVVEERQDEIHRRRQVQVLPRRRAKVSGPLGRRLRIGLSERWQDAMAKGEESEARDQRWFTAAQSLRDVKQGGCVWGAHPLGALLEVLVVRVRGRHREKGSTAGVLRRPLELADLAPEGPVADAREGRRRRGVGRKSTSTQDLEALESEAGERVCWRVAERLEGTPEEDARSRVRPPHATPELTGRPDPFEAGQERRDRQDEADAVEAHLVTRELFDELDER